MNPEEIRKMSLLEESHWWFQGKKRIIETFLDSSFIKQGDLLDIGCGTGMFLKVLASHGKAYGLDSSFQALSLCDNKPGASLVQGSGDGLPFKEGQFAVVSMLDVVEHLEDDLAIFKEAKRVCSPGGVVLVSVPAFSFLWGSHDEVHNHKRRYTRATLSRQALAAGFSIEKISYTNFFIFFPVLVKRFFSRAFGAETSDMKETPDWINTIMKKVYALEAFILKRANFPWGVSLFMLLRKTNEPVNER